MRLPFLSYVAIVIIAILTVVSLSNKAEGANNCVSFEDMEQNILIEGVKSITAKLTNRAGHTLFFVVEHDTGKWWLFRLYNGLTACGVDSGTGYVAGPMGVKS